MDLDDIKNKLKDIFFKDKISIDEDKIKELLSNNKVVLDETFTKELIDIFITYGISFKCKSVGSEYQISLEYKDVQLIKEYDKLKSEHSVLIEVISKIHKIINKEKDCKIALDCIKKIIKHLYNEG